MEKYLTLHERVKSELDHILDALDNLSNTLLSHSVIRPSVLKRMIEHVRQQLAEKYSNYELVITEVHDYYNIPVSSFDYMDGILGVFVPLFIRQSLQESMYIYVVPPQSWGDRSDTKHSKCLLLGGRRLNQLTLIPKPKGSGGARAATAQVGPANNRNDTKRCLPVEASLRPGEAVPW